MPTTLQNSFYHNYKIENATATPLEGDRIYDLLKSIPQHNDNKRYHMIRVQPQNILSLCAYVDYNRVNMALFLLQKYHGANLEPFIPIKLIYQDVVQIVMPPLIYKSEQWDQPVVLDGTHRVYASLANSHKSIIVVMIESPSENIPGDPFSWEEVYVENSSLDFRSKFKNMKTEYLSNLYTVTMNGEWLWEEQP